MSATVDVNVLLYASDETSERHARARETVERLAEGPDLLYLFWPVLMGYLRIATHPAVFENPLSPEAATRNIEALVRRPHIRTPGEDDGFWDLYTTVTDGVVVRGNLVPDAHLVTLMRQYGVTTVWSHDRDLRRVDGITVRDPFSASPR
jgi:toxin-antitoxin system PIN domain toxin